MKVILSAEVSAALAAKKAVVALESTIIAHGMAYPANVETALAVEQVVRDHGAVPATIAILGGKLKAGLSHEEIERFGKEGPGIMKVSVRDLPFVAGRGLDGATTVAATMRIAAMAGIPVFATGGMGGVHRGAGETFDVSADLTEMTHMLRPAPKRSSTCRSPSSGWKPTGFRSSATAPGNFRRSIRVRAG
jgi:pseudouridine-5'-phosphate glycosidase